MKMFTNITFALVLVTEIVFRFVCQSACIHTKFQNGKGDYKHMVVHFISYTDILLIYDERENGSSKLHFCAEQNKTIIFPDISNVVKIDEGFSTLYLNENII